MTARRTKAAARRAAPKSAEPLPEGGKIQLTAAELQGVFLEILAAVTAGLAGSNDCAMAALPADTAEDARGRVRDALLLNGVATLVSIGRIAIDDERQNAAHGDLPARAALAAALLTAFSCNAVVQDDFIRSLTEACRLPANSMN